MNVTRAFLGFALLLVIVSTGFAGEKKITPEKLGRVEVVGADVVKKWLDAGEDMFLLDARKTSDFEAGHLPDAENGMYRATRFDWSGVIGSVKYKGHEYLGIYPYM